MSPRRILPLAIPLAALACAMTAHAQQAVEVDLAEDYAPSVKVSGGVLVGLALGSLAGSVDPSKLVIHKIAGPVRPDVCFSAQTRDGQYVAETRLSGAQLPEADVSLNPRNGWKHQRELAAYSLGDFAALIRLGDNCTVDRDAVLAPVRYPGADDAHLTVFVNSQRSISATATLNVGGQTRTGSCAKANQAEVRGAAFDMTCRVEIPPGAGGLAELVVSRRARMASMKESFSVQLPAN